MAEIPEKVDLKYISGLTPSSAQVIAVGRVINQLIDYLKETEDKIAALPDMTK